MESSRNQNGSQSYVPEGDREARFARDDVENIAGVIRAAVADERLVDAVVRRVALAAADGIISRSELRRQLDYIAQRRRAGTLKMPGAYFVTCAKDLFARAGVPWSTA